MKKKLLLNTREQQFQSLTNSVLLYINIVNKNKLTTIVSNILNTIVYITSKKDYIISTNLVNILFIQDFSQEKSLRKI